jgi:galactokinase
VLLGEHVDHQGGPVLAVPLALGVATAWAVRPDRNVVVWALNARAKDRFPQGSTAKSGMRWADLARGACARVGAGGRVLPGLDLLVMGDVPARKGMASSAAYTVSILQAVRQAIGQEASPAVLAREGADVEAEWAGVQCGPMDPYVAAVGEPGDVIHLDCGTLAHETLSLPEDTELAYEDTGIERSLAATPYTQRRQELAQGLAAIQAANRSIRRLVDASTGQFESLAPRIPEPARSRCRHVVSEVERVRRCAQALRAGDARAVGALMREGHESLSKDFASSLPAIDEKVRELEARDGVFGARLQGAGWGGVIAVLRRRVPAPLAPPESDEEETA